MEEKIIEILQMPVNEESINMLCEFTNVKSFQARNLIEQYQSIEKYEVDMVMKGFDASHLTKQRWEIINGLKEGYFSSPEVQQQEFQREIIRLLQTPLREESIDRLRSLCDLDYEDAETLIDQYQTIEKHEVDVIMKGLDASHLTKQKWEIINNLSTSMRNDKSK